MKNYFKTVFQVTVLSEYPISTDCSLDTIEYKITHDDWSGQVECIEQSELSKDEMIVALEAQGSDRSFFDI